MPLRIDGTHIEVAEQSLSIEVREHLSRITASNRYVLSITINGSETTEESFHSGHDFAIHETDMVEITTCNLDELVESTVQSAHEYLPKLYTALQDATRYLRVGNNEQGLDLVSKTIDGLQWNLQVLHRLTSLGTHQSEIHDISKKATESIPLLIHALENEDYVLLADVIEFEICTWIHQWYTITSLFCSQMNLERAKRVHAAE